MSRIDPVLVGKDCAAAYTKPKTVVLTARDFLEDDALYAAEFLNNRGEACLIQVVPDNDCAESPREWDPLWTWVTTSNAGYSDVRRTYVRDGRTMREYWDFTDIEEEDGVVAKKFRKENLIAPLYLYRHSGDVISAGAFSSASPCNDPWDSGCMGIAFVSRERLKKEFGSHKYEPKGGGTLVDIGKPLERLTKKHYNRAYELLKGEVENMNMYISGCVYGFRAVNLATEREDAVWGMYCGSLADTAEMVADFLQDDDLIAGELSREEREKIACAMVGIEDLQAYRKKAELREAAA